jgi:hypothetical protein
LPPKRGFFGILLKYEKGGLDARANQPSGNFSDGFSIISPWRRTAGKPAQQGLGF